MIKQSIQILSLFVISVLLGLPASGMGRANRPGEIERYLIRHYTENPEGSDPSPIKKFLPPNPAIEIVVEDKIEARVEEVDDQTEKIIWTPIRKGTVPSEIKKIIIGKFKDMGVPDHDIDDLLYVVWRVNVDHDSTKEYLVRAFLRKLTDEETWKGQIAELTLLLDKDKSGDASFFVGVFHETPYQEINVKFDTPTSTTPYDVADVDGDGQLEIILVGQAYEASWLEVYGSRDKKWIQLFKGLAYSL